MTSANVLPYKDADQPVAARVDDLLARMTLDEKLAQVGCVWSNVLVQDDAFSEQKARELLANGTGHITRIGSTTALRPRESAATERSPQNGEVVLTADLCSPARCRMSLNRKVSLIP